MERAVVMTGIGGQGIQLIAKLLAQGAMREGRQVMMFGIFMGMIRGGSSESTVVVADAEIVAPPIVPAVWGVLAMHGEGLPKLAAKVEPGGVLVHDASLVPTPPVWERVRVIPVRASALAREIGSPMAASMVALGAFAGATGLVRVESLAEALGEVLPPHRRKLVDANRAALLRGAAEAAAQGEDAVAPAWA